MRIRRNVLHYVLVGLASLLLLGVVVLDYQLMTKTPVHVQGHSMSPNLRDGEWGFVKKATPKRFDIITFTAPDGETYIKRVIGMPGDEIEFHDNDLYINHVLTPEPYLEDRVKHTKNFTSNFALTQEGFDRVPADNYFVMGDNRENSKDSRIIGVVPKAKIHGVLQSILF